MIAVTDSSVIVGLASGGRLNLLTRLFGAPVLVPAQVYCEVTILGTGKIGCQGLLNGIARGFFLVLSVQDGPQVPANRAGAGERDAITLAQEQEADILLIDDLAARRAAARLQIPTLSTGEILVEAHKMGFLRNVRPVLDRMQAIGYPLGDYKELLRSVGEEV